MNNRIGAAAGTARVVRGLRITGCLPLLCLLGALNYGFGQQVALTFDDLPSHGPLPPGLTRVDVAKSIIGTLREWKAPGVLGLVNAKQLQDEPRDVEVLRLWVSAGFPLGNHTYSHMDLDTNSAEAFQEDIAADEAVLRTLMPAGDWHWFRYPYLHEGDTAQKREAIAAYLTHHGYKVAAVTLSFGDYAWNAPYARCAAKNDSHSIEELKASYVKAATESIRVGQEMARLVYGRDIKHVMLLHIGAFETIMLPRLMELLKEKGFTLISLDDAESDAAYKSEPALGSRWEGTLLDQMMKAKRLQRPAQAETPFANLDKLCR